MIICILLLKIIYSAFNRVFSMGIDGTHCICNENEIVESICNDSMQKTLKSIDFAVNYEFIMRLGGPLCMSPRLIFSHR